MKPKVKLKLKPKLYAVRETGWYSVKAESLAAAERLFEEFGPEASGPVEFVDRDPATFHVVPEPS